MPLPLLFSTSNSEQTENKLEQPLVSTHSWWSRDANSASVGGRPRRFSRCRSPRRTGSPGPCFPAEPNNQRCLLSLGGWNLLSPAFERFGNFALGPALRFQDRLRTASNRWEKLATGLLLLTCDLVCLAGASSILAAGTLLTDTRRRFRGPLPLSSLSSSSSLSEFWRSPRALRPLGRSFSGNFEMRSDGEKPPFAREEAEPRFSASRHPKQSARFTISGALQTRISRPVLLR